MMYTKDQLISFGNSLLRSMDKMILGDDESKYCSKVTDLDFRDWEKEANPVRQLPSRFQFGDPVIVYFGTEGILKNCTIIKIHFTESKVLYDVDVKWKHLESAENVSAGVDTDRELTDRLYNLDSAIVLSPNDFEKLQVEKQKRSNFTVRLKAHVEKCMKKSGLLEKIHGIMSYDDREDILRRFSDSLGEGAVDALKVEDCVEKYIPKQKS